MPYKGSVLVDTNTILEGHRTGCWRALAGGYRLETVEECVTETQTGAQNRPAADRIDEALLRSSLGAVHDVTPLELARVALMEGPHLDPGELALWAHALSRKESFVLCGPDRASMKFGMMHGRRDSLVSLEKLLKDIGEQPPAGMKSHFEEDWLRRLAVKIMLGAL